MNLNYRITDLIVITIICVCALWMCVFTPEKNTTLVVTSKTLKPTFSCSVS